MKKIIILTNLIILVTLAACSPEPYTNTIYELALNERLPTAYQDLLPDGAEFPSRFPATIKDPHLLAAWVYLYNQTTPFHIHSGITLTGRALAEMVIEQSVPILWGSAEICNGNSCAKRLECADLDCVLNYQPTKIHPVFISPRYQDTANTTLARLAGSLAHELYHHTLSFGPVKSSLYEEYWAYYVGAQVEQAKWALFEGYNPHSAACLMAWFRVHGQTGYFGGDVYPLTMNEPVDTTSEVCIP